MYQLKEGEVYKITHSRKGTFTVLVDSVDDTWASGEIVEGETRAMCDYNRKFEGERVDFRRSLLVDVVKVE